MKFIETLQAVGGVKPCPCCSGTGTMMTASDPSKPLLSSSQKCSECHSTGRFLDLAPLLAKPMGLRQMVDSLLFKCHMSIPCEFPPVAINDKAPLGYSVHEEYHYYPCGNLNVHVVGPRPTLTYEVARQLGGTAVVAEPKYGIEWIKDADEESGRRPSCLRQGYRLSLPIPDSATVLFVTDRFDESEMMSIMNSATSSGKFTVLPYILSLVWDGKEMPLHAMTGKETFKVISLHQEKP